MHFFRRGHAAGRLQRLSKKVPLVPTALMKQRIACIALTLWGRSQLVVDISMNFFLEQNKEAWCLKVQFEGKQVLGQPLSAAGGRL